MNASLVSFTTILAPGTFWRHYQGELVEIVCLAAEHRHGRYQVAYRSLQDGRYLLRTPASFLATVTWKDKDGTTHEAPCFTPAQPPVRESTPPAQPTTL